MAGIVWGLYNAAIGMVFGFGPAMLSERGWGPETSAAVTSIFLWLVCVSVPLGGLIADRLNKRDTVLVISCLILAVMLSWAAHTASIVPIFVVMGAIGGLAAGPIMSLPALILAPQQRSKGMGLFYTMFYICTASSPLFAGLLSDWVGTSSAAFHFGAVQLLVVISLVLWIRATFVDRA